MGGRVFLLRKLVITQLHYLIFYKRAHFMRVPSSVQLCGILRAGECFIQAPFIVILRNLPQHSLVNQRVSHLPDPTDGDSE